MSTEFFRELISNSYFSFTKTLLCNFPSLVFQHSSKFKHSIIAFRDVCDLELGKKSSSVFGGCWYLAAVAMVCRVRVNLICNIIFCYFSENCIDFLFSFKRL